MHFPKNNSASVHACMHVPVCVCVLQKASLRKIPVAQSVTALGSLRIAKGEVREPVKTILAPT